MTNMDEDEKKAKRRPSLFPALEAVLDTYGVVDYAFVGRSVDGEIHATWFAGIGDSIISDRERQGNLYFELEHLQAHILAANLSKK